jgi:hypothetical protein
MAQHRQSTYYKILNINTGYEKQWGYYNKCPCNEFDSIINRHCLCQEVDQTHTTYLRFQNKMKETSDKLSKQHDFKKWDFKTLIQNTRTKKRGRYRNAYLNLKNNRHISLNSMAKIQTFIKYEKISQDKLDDRKPARLIQHRSYEYLYLLKSFVGPMADIIKRSNIKINDRQQLSEIFGVGMSIEELSNRIVDVHSRHLKPVVLCIDHSKWDGHFNKYLMKECHKFWKALMKDHLFSKLLDMQLNNSCITQNGLRYKCEASRMSGEYTTSIENSLANYFILQSIFPNASIIVNGDDSLVFLDHKDYDKNINIPALFTPFGQETKLDKVAYTIDEIDFCQHRMIKYKNGYKLCRSLDRFLGRIQYCDKKLNDLNYDKYIAGMALCELNVVKGMPILQNFCCHLLGLAKFRGPLEIARDDFKHISSTKLELQEVSWESRQSFSDTFNISITEQLRLEKIFSYESKTVTNYLEKHQQFVEGIESWTL